MTNVLNCNFRSFCSQTFFFALDATEKFASVAGANPAAAPYGTTLKRPCRQIFGDCESDQQQQTL